MTIDELRKASEAGSAVLTDEMTDRLLRYAGLLREWNEKMNLTAITEPEEVYEKHFLDSLIPLSQVRIAGRAADVGTGAGFPGLVWAIAREDLDITLIEPTGKRCTFLKTVIRELGIKNVTVENCRAEDYAADHREEFDVVAARAVAALPVLSELCVPLVRKGGIFLAMKGAQGKEEAKASLHALKALGCSEPQLFEAKLPSGDIRINVATEKISKTPEQYPRPYARIKKKPL